MKKVIMFLILIVTVSIIKAQTIEDQIFLAINQHRHANGLPPFLRSKSLDNAAKHHAKYVVLLGKVTHIESESVPGIKLLRDLDDRAIEYGGSALAENIVGTPIARFNTSKKDSINSANNAVNLWKKSPEHNANLLLQCGGPYPVEIGIGIYEKPRKEIYDNPSYIAVALIGFTTKK